MTLQQRARGWVMLRSNYLVTAAVESFGFIFSGTNAGGVRVQFLKNLATFNSAVGVTTLFDFSSIPIEATPLAFSNHDFGDFAVSTDHPGDVNLTVRAGSDFGNIDGTRFLRFG